MFVCLLNMFSWVWFIHGSLQDVILQFWYQPNPMLVILGCCQTLYTFGTFIQLKVILPMCVAFSPPLFAFAC